MNSKTKIVLVEDDTDLSAMMTEFLSEQGYDVTPVLDGAEAVSTILDLTPDLVILDIMLPNVDGIEVCRQIRRNFTNPVIMLTAKDDDLIEVASLQQGADNYLTKPTRPHVLLAHIKATLRRQPTSATPTDSNCFEVQDITIDPSSLTAKHDGKVLDLTSGEFELLLILVENAGHPVSRETLYQKTRGIEYDGLDRSIDLRISTLRKKLGDHAPPYRYIKTVRNKGYQLSTH